MQLFSIAMMKELITFSLSALTIFSMQQSVLGQEAKDEYYSLSLEELLKMEITSMSKKVEKLQNVPSAIYVVSGEELLKSGATTLHEVLRNVPGYWGVQDHYNSVYSSIRNSPTPNADPGTVLYLLDGTSVQNTMGSVFSFENFDIPLDEIDRIEIIKGSGGTVYGANSASGVVSIFTKNPENYDGVNTRLEAASPGYFNATVRAGGVVSDRLATSGYVKYRFFTGWESLAGKDANGESTGFDTQLTEDYDKSTYYSAGTKFNYSISDFSTLSARVHFNAYNKNTYTSVYDDSFILTNNDSDPIFLNEVNANRTVANIRFDHQFSERNAFFARLSSNIENDFYRLGGGMSLSNAIYDLEVQDNFSIGEHIDFIAGFNYRLVRFNVHDINATTNINYIDPQSNETISSAFVQSSLKAASDRLHFTVGIKAENYTLVNENYYFSPTSKFSFVPNEKVTLWGGVSQSYTTPGFNSTNLDYVIFQTADATVWDIILRDQVAAGVYNTVYEDILEQTGNEVVAASEATAYLESDQGQQAIAAGIQDNSLPNLSLKNGSNTVPTRFRNVELGIKANLGSKLHVDASFFKTYIKDGIAASEETVLQDEPSVTQPGFITDYYLYGNYVKGESAGSEMIIKWYPIHNLLFETSYTYLKTNWDFQENDDFDISVPIEAGESPQNKDPFIPEHVFRCKVDYSFGSGFNATGYLTTTSRFHTQERYYYAYERYARPEEVDSEGTSSLVAENGTRTILNLRLEKAFYDDQITVYLFGNDITNAGIVADTDNIRNLTLSHIGAMYGGGFNFKLK